MLRPKSERMVRGAISRTCFLAVRRTLFLLAAGLWVRRGQSIRIRLGGLDVVFFFVSRHRSLLGHRAPWTDAIIPSWQAAAELQLFSAAERELGPVDQLELPNLSRSGNRTSFGRLTAVRGENEPWKLVARASRRLLV